MLAAGEVVERPASVVKELVENSIDAGATAVDIRIEEGGERLIEVSDNGIGIAQEDMRAAFLPHATSKIKNILDLDSLSTLGFRGEALASIASVSEVTAISAQKGAGAASKLVLSGGKVIFEGLASRETGTTISVENLFFNTPARLKFLKKASVEQKYIEEIVGQLILANPELSISLVADGECVLSHAGGSLFDAIVAVYGAKYADSLIAIDHERNGIRVKGYTSSPDCTKSVRAYQTAIVNGRAVNDQTVQTAAEKAYGDLLMKRSFPIYVLDIILPFDEVDVNVHPSKTEVRFANKQAVFGAVYHAVYDAVHAGGMISASDARLVDNADESTEVAAFEPQSLKNSAQIYQPRIDTSRFFGAQPKRPAAFRESAFIPDDTYAPAPSYLSSSDKFPQTEQASDISAEEAAYEQIFDGKIVGQVFATYLIVERDERMYIIDQHAAHERILYDKISQKLKPEFAQPLLIPHKLMLTGDETERFETLLAPLKELGFEISFNGANYIVESVPQPIAGLNLGKFFSDMLVNAPDKDDLTLASLMRDSLCQQACKAAIKGGENLNREQIERVLNTLADENGQLPQNCPHGRPTVISFSKTDIEKLFKRIV